MLRFLVFHSLVFASTYAFNLLLHLLRRRHLRSLIIDANMREEYGWVCVRVQLTGPPCFLGECLALVLLQSILTWMIHTSTKRTQVTRRACADGCVRLYVKQTSLNASSHAIIDAVWRSTCLPLQHLMQQHDLGEQSRDENE